MTIRSLLLAGVVAAGGFAVPAYADGGHRSDADITAQLNKAQLRHPGVAAARKWARAHEKRMAKTEKPSTDRDFATAYPNPSGATKMASRTANEIDQAVGLKRPISAQEMTKAVPLDRVMNPLHSLDTAEIKSQQGEPIGDVRSVEITKDGTARAVRADVGGFLGMAEKVVTIPAGKLLYLKDRNLLVTGMSRGELSRLASNDT